MTHWGDFSRALFVWTAFLVVTHAVATFALDKAGRYALWDERALEQHRIDYSWELDLILMAEDGEWSAVDFQYPRGPLFQLLAWLPTAARPGAAHPPPGEPGDVGWMLLGAEALVQLVCLALALGIAFCAVRGRWRRLAVAIALGSLAFGAGIETLRALMSALVVLTYGALELRWRRHPWRGAFLVAGLVALAGMLSFERWALCWIALLVMHGVELFGRLRRGAALRPAWRRLGRVAAAQTLICLALAIALHALGGSSWDYLSGSFRTGVSYASTRSIPWLSHGVSPVWVGAFLAAALAIAVGWVAGAPRRRRYAQWIFGASAFSVFALFRPYPGQIFLGLAPAAVVLAVIAGRTVRLDRLVSRAGWRLVRAAGHGRVLGVPAGGALCAALLVASAVAWFGAYPETLWWRPTNLRRGVAMLEGELERDSDHVTEIGQAARWLLSNAPDDACFGVYPGATALYALTGGDGPTRGCMRWTDGGPEALAASIRSADCPHHVQVLYSFDRGPAAGMAFGEDFLAVSELYRPRARVGPSTYVLERREEPAPAQARPLPLRSERRTHTLRVGERLHVGFDGGVAGHELVALDYRLSLVGLLPPPLVNVPRLKVRFTLGGQPVGEWQPINERAVDAPARLHAAPDPEAAERRFLVEREVYREVIADGLELSVEGVGWRTAREVRLTIEGAQALTHPLASEPPPARGCDRRVSLLPLTEDGRALVRNVGLGDEEGGFDLDANPPLADPPEVFLPTRPCPGTCVHAELSVDAPEDAPPSDGVGWEVHVIDRENRSLLHSAPMEPGESEAVSLPLEAFAGRDVWVRFSVTSGDDPDGDYARVDAPRVSPCEEAGDPHLDPLVFGEAASELARGRQTEMSRALDWARDRFEQAPGACVALRPSGAGLTALRGLTAGPGLVTWTADGLARLGGEEALACEHLIYDAGSFDQEWVAGRQLAPGWPVLFERFAPEARLSPRLWLLRRREAPRVAPTRPIEIAREPNGTHGLAPAVASDHFLSLRYSLRCEGDAATDASVEVRFFAGERQLGPYVRIPLWPDAEGRGELSLSPRAGALERRWAAGEASLEPPVDHLSLAVSDGCRLEVGELTAHAPPAPPIERPTERCDAIVDLVRAVERGEAWVRSAAPIVRGGALELSENPRGDPLPEVFVPFVPCAASCLTVSVEPLEGPVSVEAHLIDDPDRARVVHERLEAGTGLVTRTVGLTSWALRPALLRLGLGSGQGRARVHLARVEPCHEVAP